MKNGFKITVSPISLLFSIAFIYLATKSPDWYFVLFNLIASFFSFMTAVSIEELDE